MCRYLLQRDRTSCQRVFIVNAQKWAGLPATGRDLPRLKRVFSARSLIDRRVIEGQLSPWLGIRRARPSIGTVERHLRSGGAIGLQYAFDHPSGKRCAHTTLITAADRGLFCLANNGWYAADWIFRVSLVELMRRRRHRGVWFPRVWLLTANQRSSASS